MQLCREMNKRPKRRKYLLIALAAGLPVALLLVGVLVFQLLGYYFYSTGVPHDPADHGYTPIEEVTEAKGGFVMRRYRIKAHWLARYLAGNPHQRTDDGYDTVIVISDWSGEMIARLSHWDGELKVIVTPAGVTGPDGMDWKAPP